MCEKLNHLLKEYKELTLELGEFGTWYAEVDRKSERHRFLESEINRILNNYDYGKEIP